MSKSIVLSILSLSTIVAGKFVSQFAVVDQDGALVGAKAHKTEAEAQAELASLKFYTVGLEYARATAKEGMSNQAIVGKANAVASFLMYQEQVANGTFKAAEAVEEVAEEVAEVVEEATEF